jgi:divalent metal cation (Fe/Co/Zn/Cd) transporter
LSHEHQPNLCVVPGCEENPKARRLRKVLRITTASNVAYGVLQIATGMLTGSSAALSDGVHNAVDVFSHGAHTATHVKEQDLADEHSELNERKVQRRRKLAALAITAGALIAGGQAVDHFVNRESEPLNQIALYVELGGLALNGALAGAVWLNNDKSRAAVDSFKHDAADTAISVVAVTSIYANQFIAGADAVGGMVGAAASLWVAKEVWQDKHSHEHEHDATTITAELR